MYSLPVSIFVVLACLSVPAVGADKSPSADRQEELLNLLQHDCGACHGITLKGGLGPSLLAVDLQEKADQFLVTTILAGREGTAMPPWQRFMSEDEAFWLVNYLRKAH